MKIFVWVSVCLLCKPVHLAVSSFTVGMSGNQSTEELTYPKLHKCIDLGEAYSAAYLTTKVHLVETNIVRNLTMVSCEMASSIMLQTAKRKDSHIMREKLHKFRTDPNTVGIAIMSLDVLDYSVVFIFF